MAQFKCLAFASAILLVCNFAAATPHWTEFNGTVVIDRENKSISSSGYYMALNDVDRTTFAVNQDIWLERFEIATIYEYNITNNYSPLKENKIAQMKIMETNSSGFSHAIYSVNASVNSYNEVEVPVHPEILLNRSSTYQIQVLIPHKNGTMYNENLGIKEYYVATKINSNIGVKFFQRNPLDTLPPNNTDFNRQLTRGVVKRLHLKY